MVGTQILLDINTVQTSRLNFAPRHRFLGRGESSGATAHLKGNGMMFLPLARMILIACCVCWPSHSVLLIQFSSCPFPPSS